MKNTKLKSLLKEGPSDFYMVDKISDILRTAEMSLENYKNNVDINLQVPSAVNLMKTLIESLKKAKMTADTLRRTKLIKDSPSPKTISYKA